MGIVLKLTRIHLVWAAFFGDLTLELITAATYQYQTQFQALLAAIVFFLRMRNGA